ncbi:PREDICTED: ATP-dependent bile acid permease-like [Nelumbo nucifera]|uniref:ATP-dependent bile acid permease-like n=2 Tax=Nelumbo nucifera TaxID=4432 RepID=A0A1U8Q7R6_NELNU|nr:PREDICTED: ATP-dependent bile acid permease-like [Nelumbo nucifera]DAD47552.1 TPA_asm: hypothetical protein HUJ06_017489 [Nelumbo nucifera]
MYTGSRDYYRHVTGSMASICNLHSSDCNLHMVPTILYINCKRIGPVNWDSNSSNSPPFCGSATIRAFNQENRFIETNLILIDKYSRPWFHNMSATEWISFRLHILSNFVFAFSVVLLVSLPHGIINPSENHEHAFSQDAYQQVDRKDGPQMAHQ